MDAQMASRIASDTRLQRPWPAWVEITVALLAVAALVAADLAAHALTMMGLARLPGWHPAKERV